MICISNTYAQTAKEYFNRGIDKSNLKDYTGAILDYTKAIELNPKNAVAYYNRGIAKLNLVGSPDGGCLDLSKAGELGLSDAYDMIKKRCN